MRIKQRFYDYGEFSVTTVAIISNLIFLSFVTISASLTYIQFDYLDIVKVCMVFVLLLVALLSIFEPWLFRTRIELNWKNLFWSVLVSLGLIALLNSPSKQFLSYFQTFPLLEAELGLGWHQDSAFHVSIIKSIENFGFPSISQHDNPLLIYHVLSHYVDTFLIRISGVDAWESYGLFYYFKSALLISTLVLLVTTACKDRNSNVFLLSLLFLAPAVVGTWHAVGSHGLWFTSLVIILSSPYVFGLLSTKEDLKTKNYLGLFFLLVIISLGKVSSGFSYALLIGFTLLFAHPKSVKVFVFGAFLMVFFATYGFFMSGNENAARFTGFQSLVSFISLKTSVLHNQLHQIYLLIAVAGAFAWKFRSKGLCRLMLSSIAAVFSLAAVISLQPNYSTTDIWYFLYGLSSVLLLLLYQHIVSLCSKKEVEVEMNTHLDNNKNLTSLMVVGVLLLTSQLSLASLNLFNLSMSSIKNITHNLHPHPSSKLSEYFRQNENVTKKIFGERGEGLTNFKRPLKDFKLGLTNYMEINSLSKKNTLLYIPKEIFVSSFAQFQGHSWARGMLAYAVTGVPLIHGLEDLRRTYGYSDYDEASLWVGRESFNESKACELNKNIIIVENFEDAEFTLVKCDLLSETTRKLK